MLTQLRKGLWGSTTCSSELSLSKGAESLKNKLYIWYEMDHRWFSGDLLLDREFSVH